MRLNSTSVLWDRSLFAVFGIFIFTSTFSVAAGSLAGGATALLFLIITVGRRYSPCIPALNWFYIWAGLYLFWSVLSSQMADPGLRSLAPLGREWLLVLVPAGIWIFQNERVSRILMQIFACGVILISLYSVGQFFWGWNFLKPGYPIAQSEHGYYIAGNFTSAVTFGIYYATAGLFLFAGGLKTGVQRPDNGDRLLILAGLLGMSVAVLSNERGPTLAVLSGLLVLALVRRSRRVWIGVGVAVLLVVAMGFQSGVFARAKTLMAKELSLQHDRSRLFIWTYSFRVALDHPVVGVGPGQMREAYADVVPDDIPDVTIQGHAHNDFLTVAAESGFPAAVFLLALWVTVLGFCYRAQRADNLGLNERALALGALIGSTGFLMTSLFDIPFGHSTTRQMLMFIWGAGLGMYVKSYVARSRAENRTA